MHRTTSFCGVLLPLLLLAGLPGQRSQERLRAQHAAKVAKPFIKHGGWRLDYDAARAQAQRQGKLLLVYFTRSYAP